MISKAKLEWAIKSHSSFVFERTFLNLINTIHSCLKIGLSATGLKSEVIRLVNEMDENLMEDLLSSIKIFAEQQEPFEIDTNTPDLIKSLNKSLDDVGQNKLLSNEEIQNETKKWLTR